MSDEVLVAILGMVGTGFGSMLGVVAASKLTQYRLKQLEEKVNKHNNIIERTYRLEGEMVECQHDIRDIKSRI